MRLLIEYFSVSLRWRKSTISMKDNQIKDVHLPPARESRGHPRPCPLNSRANFQLSRREVGETFGQEVVFRREEGPGETSPRSKVARRVAALGRSLSNSGTYNGETKRKVYTIEC